MNHGQVISEIQVKAYARGLLTHYCADSRRCRGHSGFPDLVIAGGHDSAFLEVKTGDGRLTPQQLDWSYRLAAAGDNVHLIRLRDLLNGRVDDILDKLM